MRNLKALGLALVAMFAMSAVVASAASASTKGWLTSDGPVKLTGTDTVGEKSKLTGFGNLSVACHGHYDIGTVGEEGPHDGNHLFDMWDEVNEVSETTVTSMTVDPTYEQAPVNSCVGTIGETNAPLTVTMNGCDYVLTLGNTIEAGKYAVTADLECPESNQIEVHAYTSTSHGSTICTTKVPEQTGLTGASAETIEEGGVHKLTLQGPVKGITASKTGILCGGTAHTESAELDIHAILSGFNEEGEATDITITDETS